MLQLILFSSIYTLVFTGSYVVSGFLNIVYPTDAFISFAIFYSVYAVCSIFAPFIFTKLKLWSLIIAAISFLIMVGLAASINKTLLYIGYAIGGAGNSVVWLSQGVWISKQSGDQTKLMGIFWGVFNISLVLGNLISIIILMTSANIQLMLFCMMIPTGLGLILAIIFYIMNKNVIDVSETPNLIQSLKDVFLSITYKRYLIIPLMMYSGIGLNVTYQVLPILLNRYSTALGSQTVAIYNACMFLAYGVSAAIASVMWGMLFKKGWKWVMIPYLILELLCLTGIYLLGWFGTSNTAGCYIIFGIVRGITDYAVNNMLNITISTFSGKTDGAFGFYRLVYAISYMIFSICIGYISIWIIIIISIVCAIVSAICYVLYQIFKPSELEQEFNNSAIQIN